METDFSEYSPEQISSIQQAIDGKKTTLLSANWGVGKTYFIKSLLETKYSDKKIRYASLFGIETMDRLIQKLINPEINLSEKSVEILGMTLPIHELNSFLNGGANLLISQIKDEIIVLDDLERSHLDYTLVLGLIDKLKENNSIIFICNRNKISSPEFLNQIEKVSDRIIDDISIDFNTVMKKIMPSSILDDVLYSFFLLKEDNLRIAIKLSEYFKIIKDYIPSLSYKEVRLFSCLAIEKIKNGYLNEFYDLITVDPFKKIESFLYNREIKINKNIEKKFKIRQDGVELQNESLKQEYESFVSFLKKINDEEFYHTKPCLVDLLRHEFLDKQEFVRQTWSFHDLFKNNNLTFEILYPENYIENHSEEEIKEIQILLKNTVSNLSQYITNDSVVDLNVFYNIISSYFYVSQALDLDPSIELNLDIFDSLVKNIKDTEFHLIKYPNGVTSNKFESVYKEIRFLIENEKNQRNYTRFLNTLKNNDLVGFYKNNYNDSLFDFLNSEFLEIIVNNYLIGSKLSKDIIALVIKDYQGDKKDRRDQSTKQLKSLLLDKLSNSKDKFVKQRIEKLLAHKGFISLITAPKIGNLAKQIEQVKVTEPMYLNALEDIKKHKKDSNEYKYLKKLIFDYKTQMMIDNAESSEYRDLEKENQFGFAPGDKVRFTSRDQSYKTIASVGEIYTLKSKVKYKNDLKLWLTEELGDWSISEKNFIKE